MKKILLFVVVISNLSACSGFEIGGKLGAYSVQHHSEQSESHYKPISCLWKNCTEPQGS